MSDRELLEWAAKAAGKRITGWNTAQGEEVAVLDDGSFWQPLHKNRITEADGDALRLAVRLGIAFSCRKGNAQAVVERGPGGWFFEPFDEPVKDDKDAATRRAIVRAAASIGQQKGE